MYLPITTIVTAILAVLFVVLSLKVIGRRRAAKVSLGDGGDDQLERRIRAQGNLAEYAPIGLLLILVAEAQSANQYLLGLAAIAFVIGRLLHGYALSYRDKAVRPRILGMQLTLFSILGLAALNLWNLAVSHYS